jgi:hypothetical protein
MYSEICVDDILTENFDGKFFFVLLCKIVSGAIGAGLNVNVSFGTGLDMTIPIDEIEVVGGNGIKIKVYCEDLEEVEFLRGLNLVGEVLRVE